jgi:hypothetical protein
MNIALFSRNINYKMLTGGVMDYWAVNFHIANLPECSLNPIFRL